LNGFLLGAHYSKVMASRSLKLEPEGHLLAPHSADGAQLGAGGNRQVPYGDLQLGAL